MGVEYAFRAENPEREDDSVPGRADQLCQILLRQLEGALATGGVSCHVESQQCSR